MKPSNGIQNSSEQKIKALSLSMVRVQARKFQRFIPICSTNGKNN
jgi:hypothetical protein